MVGKPWLLATTVALCALVGLPAAAVDVGDIAPGFELTGRTTSIKLGDYKGQTIYLDFWASWCGPCKQSFPWMNTLQARYAAHGLRVVAVNVDKKAEDANAFLRGNPASFDVAFDAVGRTPKSYAILSMPTSVLIGPDGKVLQVHRGFREAERTQREQDIKQALHL